MTQRGASDPDTVVIAFRRMLITHGVKRPLVTFVASVKEAKHS